MYKIYINNTPLLLTSSTEVAHLLPGTEENPVGLYIGKPKFLMHYIDMLEKTNRFQSVTIFAANAQLLFQDFQSLFEIVEAAGGVVYNPNREILLIYRRGSWDLPKGKIDAGESREAAAVREVQEETGLQNVSLSSFITTTYHTYRDKNDKRILKPTYWYRMETDEYTVTPQTEEDIEKVVWQNPTVFLETESVVYPSIVEVLQQTVN